ncbi:MAG TPA: DUF4249 domain-containing protein [Mucilaginibacter sp.]|jgi:hypothetical protein|nr:DUF4249 domain-containing protein [Mucilaginibacter sp.]
MKKTTVIIIIVALGWWGCKQVYNPHPIATATNYLVVEGAINTGTDSTLIHLSRTAPVSSKGSVVPELGAVVTIIGDGGASYPCIETGNGYYTAAGLNAASGNFGLKINTRDGKLYQSDLVAAKNSPPIDSVYYRIQGNGLEIYADSHDPANNTKYYRWDYVGTYEFHSAFDSKLYLQTVPVDSVMPRPLANQIYICWRNDISSTILVNSSAKLATDIITQNPIQFLPSTAEELENRYSILVKQYALTADAYNYYTQLKRNTEQLGGVFDPQPSQLTGNIHCISNPGEPVLGYITAGSAAESRIYINNRNLPAWLASTPYSQCLLDTDLYNQPSGRAVINMVQARIYTGFDVPVYTIQPPMAAHPDGYTGSSEACVDCTLRGTNQKPAFWIDE